MTRHRHRGRRRNQHPDHQQQDAVQQNPDVESSESSQPAPPPETEARRAAPARDGDPPRGRNRGGSRNRNRDRGPEREASEAAPERQRTEAPKDRSRESERPPAEQRGGSGRTGRRRPGRRTQIAPVTGEIFRRHAKTAPMREAPARHTFGEGDGPPVLGCPMYSRTHIGMPGNGGETTPRCALAWAIHTEGEARFCLETPDHTQCWKSHPERLIQIQARLQEQTGD